MQKINLETAFELFRGCVKPGVRMNEALLNFYNENEKRVIRARAASGVRIAMETDAVEIDYSVEFGGTARKIFTTDFVINGSVTTVDGSGPHKIRLAPGTKEVVIHLPHLVVIEKLSLAVNDGASVKPAPAKDKKLLICGDSILQGMTCTTPTRAVGALLAEKLGVDFHNTSVGGAVMTSEAVAATAAIGGDLMIVCFGCNDIIATEFEVFKERTDKVMEILGSFPGKAFIIVPIPCMTADPATREKFCAAIRDAQKNFPNVTLIEAADFYPADSELFVDGIHPNDRGMEIYADGLAKIIAPAVR